MRRYTERFIAAGGVQALAAVLEGGGELPQQLRLAVVALDCLTRSGGAAACEAALGWWAPSLPEGVEAGGEPEAAATARAEVPEPANDGHHGADAVMTEVRPVIWGWACRSAGVRDGPKAGFYYATAQ